MSRSNHGAAIFSKWRYNESIAKLKLCINSEFIPNRILKASKDCGFRLCQDGLDAAGATRVATEFVQHISGMAETLPLCGECLAAVFFRSSFRRYKYRPSVVPKKIQSTTLFIHVEFSTAQSIPPAFACILYQANAAERSFHLICSPPTCPFTSWSWRCWRSVSSKVLASMRPKKSRVRATRPVQPV